MERRTVIAIVCFALLLIVSIVPVGLNSFDKEIEPLTKNIIQPSNPIQEPTIKPEPKRPIIYDEDGDGWVTIPFETPIVKCLNLEKRIYEAC